MIKEFFTDLHEQWYEQSCLCIFREGAQQLHPMLIESSMLGAEQC